MKDTERVVIEEDQVVVKSDGMLMVLDEDEFCCVCKSVENLMAFGIGDPADPMKFTVCKPCYPDGSDSRFHKWFAGEIERELSEHPEKWRKNSNGTWTDLTRPFDKK